MKVISQIQIHNAEQVKIALKEGKREHDKIHPSVHEAAVIAGEFIAAKNQKESAKLEDVISHFRPEYLKKRGL